MSHKGCREDPWGGRLMRVQRSRGAYTTNLPKPCQQMQLVVPEEGARTHFPDSQNDVALEHKGDRLWVRAGIAGIRFCRCAPEACDL